MLCSGYSGVGYSSFDGYFTINWNKLGGMDL